MTDDPEHHHLRSEFIRRLVQQSVGALPIDARYVKSTPKTIVQFWHDLDELPDDIRECMVSWTRWTQSGFRHVLFDQCSAKAYIRDKLGARHERAFQRCYHPAMQSDYFRLCYVSIEGGCYVDADDVCVGTRIEWLFNDGRLKVQPLCYDISSGTMVTTSSFLARDAYEPDWIVYFNNNPLIADSGHPVIERALQRATGLLDVVAKDVLPEIQETTGPGNLSRSIFDLGISAEDLPGSLVVLREWDKVAVSQWPLSHRDDARNWRLSNQRQFLDNDRWKVDE